MARLVIVRNGADWVPQPQETVLQAADLPPWIARGGPMRWLMRYDEATIATPDLCHAGRPLAIAAVARLCSRGDVVLVDAAGRRRRIGARDLARWTAQVAFESLERPWFVRRVRRRVEREWAVVTDRRPLAAVDFELPCAYLRTDLSFGVRAGGSVGHIAGVINTLHELGLRPVFITTDRVPTVAQDVETHVICPSERYWSARELPAFVMDEVSAGRALEAIGRRRIGFIYQRYSLNNFAGVRLARELNVPLVIEYNGSEPWVSQYWSARPLVYADLSLRIEALNFAAADLIVVVSDAIRDELARRGVDLQKVLVNPNGVAVDRYSPAVDGSVVRRRYGFESELVYGFIGTFGAWHGAEVLAEAYGRLLARRPDLRSRTRLLFIGDGARLAATRALIAAAGAAANTVFTGLVPQAEGAEHLAACDVLVSPHVPNPDGSPFFGSPTKLFEYMAMGRAIIASDLNQIGRVLRHGETAWLVTAGDADSLGRALERSADDGTTRRELGVGARRDAVAHHSWHQHTRCILDALGSVAHPSPEATHPVAR
jgi:glycosyltransferase involved in cell wall biosynthesis